MNRLITCAGLAVVLGFPNAAAAQSVTIGLHGTATTHNEDVSTNRVDGLGGAASITVSYRKLTVEGLGAFASMSPAEDPAVADFDIVEGQVHARYLLRAPVAIEAGYIRRNISPTLAAQEVGSLSLGAYLETGFSNVAQMFARGAFIPIATFDGGGDLGLSYQVGFGFSVGTAAARWRVRAEYDFQHFGRSVRSVDVPIQVETARLGFVYRVL